MYDKQAVFIVACAGLLLAGIALFTPGALALELRLYAGAGEDVFAALPFGILTGLLLLSGAGGRYGHKMWLVTAACLLGLGLQGIAGASATWLKVCFFICGVGGGMMYGAANTVVADISARGKWASLSLLGVSPGIGLLGMPQMLAVLKTGFSWCVIVSAIGWLCFAMGFVFAQMRFPQVKRRHGGNGLNDPLLAATGLFLMFQLSAEMLVYRRVVDYLTAAGQMSARSAAFALSLYIAGFTVMRLLSGSFFRTAPPVNMLSVSLLLIPAGIVLLQAGEGFVWPGLVLLGAGLAGGFPLMLGWTAGRFPAYSGGAFGFVLSVAFAGNMLMDGLAEWVVNTYGVRHVVTLALLQWLLMLLVYSRIMKRRLQ